MVVVGAMAVAAMEAVKAVAVAVAGAKETDLAAPEDSPKWLFKAQSV